MADPVPPIAVALRPLTVAEMLDRAITITVRSIVVLAGIYVVYAAPLVLLQYFGAGDTVKVWQDIMHAATLGGIAGQEEMQRIMRSESPLSPALLVIFGMAFLVSPLPTGALLWADATLYARGGAVTFRRAYRAGLRSWLPLLGVNLLWIVCGLLAYIVVALVFGIAVFIGVLFGAASPALGIGVGVVLGLILLAGLVIVGSAVAVAVYVSYLSIVVERMGFASAFTSALTRVFARAFRRSVLAGLALLAIWIGVSLIGLGGQALSYAVLHSAMVGVAFNALVGVVVALFVAMFMTITYYDLLIRTEGFDLRSELAAQIELAGPATG